MFYYPFFADRFTEYYEKDGYGDCCYSDIDGICSIKFCLFFYHVDIGCVAECVYCWKNT